MRKNQRSDSSSGLTRRDLLRSGPLLLLPLSSAPLQTRESRRDPQTQEETDVVIENSDFRFVLGGDGTARSLIEKWSGQECLATGSKAPAFSMTQYSPLAGQLILLDPADAKTFAAGSVRREGDRLLIAFDGVPHQVALRLKVAPHYVAFTVDQVQTEGKGWEASDRLKTPIEELVFLQLPLRERTNFGSWLNVMWDDDVAVNLLGADPWCRIDAAPRDGYRLVRASTEGRVRTVGVSAALIATRTAGLLDRIGEIERDFNLPGGVESRRRKEYRYSYYWGAGVTPSNVARHIQYARTAGFPMLMVSYRDFSRSAGHFPWRPEYALGMDDLTAVVREIRSAGIIPGLHIHYSKAEKTDPYVTGRPDGRLNSTRVFTLAEPLDRSASTIRVEENPAGATLDDERRFLKIGSELITYANYTTSPPYEFTDCRRAQLGSKASAYEAGIMFGLLDVDTWPIFVRFNQNTTIQHEVAERIAGLYKAGFEFVYFDGAEDVHIPFWFTTSWAQWVVWQALDRPPLLAEGAQRAHFNWHITSRSNAYDVQQPEAMKPAMHAYQEVQAPRTAQDFTGINFGWMGYRAPGPGTIGTQPDMVEYVVSRAAAWNCAFSLNPRLDALDAHARTPDNLEVMRRWQEVVARDWLSAAQKGELRGSHGDYTLLVNGSGAFELAPCEQIIGPAGEFTPLRAFVFERGGKIWVVYWHTSGRSLVQISLPGSGLALWDQPERRAAGLERTASAVALPAEGRRYLDCGGLSKGEVVRAFQNCKVMPG